MARIDDHLLLHGSNASRLMRHLATGTDVCVSVTHLDGVVVARSVFHNSMNYRSVVVFGTARIITDPGEKLAALRSLVERVLPGRWEEARQPSDKELRATTILEVSLAEASAKLRSGPPQDDETDLDLPVWAGEIPLRLQALAPEPDPILSGEIRLPESVKQFRVPPARDEVSSGTPTWHSRRCLGRLSGEGVSSGHGSWLGRGKGKRDGQDRAF